MYSVCAASQLAALLSRTVSFQYKDGKLNLDHVETRQIMYFVCRDVLHELIGHCPMFADPEFAQVIATYRTLHFSVVKNSFY